MEATFDHGLPQSPKCMTFFVLGAAGLSLVLPPRIKWQELKETEELDIQLKVFNENKDEDFLELSHRLEDIRAEMEYPLIFSSWGGR